MFYYFHSDSPCALKINGVFYGILSNDVKNVKIDVNNPYIELCPVSVSEPCVNLLIDENFLFSPHESITITDLKGGYLIKFNPIKKQSEFSIIAQEKCYNAIVTLFNENGLKLSIETQNDLYAESFPINIKEAEIKEFSLNNERFIALSMRSEQTYLCVYKTSEKVQKVFCKNVFSYSLDNGFSTVEKFNDIQKHTLTCFWEYDNFAFKKTSSEISVSEDFCLDNINEKLIPYCFLESFLVGENCDCYLCESILKNKAHLKGFFGDFIGVMPPPKFRDIDEVGLIYRKTENFYFVEYFKFSLSNKKILSLTKCD